jgi:RNA polymerase sigma factor (sigma-70 family)
MNMTLMGSAVVSDEQLWRSACAGDREAFSKIVERYQSLICSLAYSACGTLGTSEDMAQETFITAWHQLKDLRDPAKLRQWLCGIVRNIAANSVRRNLRRGGEPMSLDTIADQPCEENDPVAQTITREEEMVLWRTLADLPANYREPLVLFYREEKSISEVADKLDLTEDTVKQRLSRGRAMLREEVAQLVETTLVRTRPTAAFTLAVLGALPAVSLSKASAAVSTGAVVGKGAAALGKSVAGSVGTGALCGPAIGLTIGFFSSRAAAMTARSPQERACILRHGRRLVIFCFAMSIGLAAVLTQAGKLYPVSPGGLIVGIGGWTTALVLTIVFSTSRMQRKVDQIRRETGTTDSANAEEQSARMG